MSSQTTRKKTPKKNVSKEALKVTALKKRETTIRAMTIIEKMIEGKVEEKYLLQSVHFITQDQYQDITEERAITKLCGYPLCCLPLKDIPNKTYHICTRQNKVYDITERKNFCSNGCYKASVFLKNQLLTSPLWLREAEEKPNYTVIHLNDGGGMGDEVDLGHQRVQLSDLTNAGNDETFPRPSVNGSSSKPHESRTSAVTLTGTKKHGCDPPAKTSGPFLNVETPVEETKIRTDKNEESSGLISKQETRGDVVKGKTLTDLPSAKSEKEIPGSVEPSNTIEYVQLNTMVSSDTKIGMNLRNVSAKTSESKGTCSSQQLEASKIEPTKDSKEISTVANKSESCMKDSKIVNQQTDRNEHFNIEGSEAASTENEIDSKEENPVGNVAEISWKEHNIVDGEHAKNECSSEEGTSESNTKKNPRREKPTVVNEVERNSKEPRFSDPKPVGSESSRKEEDSKSSSKNKATSKKESKFKKERHKTKEGSAKDESKEKNDRKTVLLEVVKHIEKCLREWITFDSLILLLGDEAVKTLLKSKGKEFNECQNFCGADSSTYEKYLSICRKLNLLELEDARLDTGVKEKNADLKPLPDYSLLQREAKQLEIKVRSFYEGSTRIEYVESTVEQSSETENSTIVLPLVDLHAQKALRRRIVLDRLNVVLPDLGRTLNLGIFNLTSSVRHLSQTFNFSPHNITFKPPEWYFIAMVLVKLISLQDRTLKAMIETDTAEKYLTLLLMNWGLDAGYLDRLITWLTDVDFLIQKN